MLMPNNIAGLATLLGRQQAVRLENCKAKSRSVGFAGRFLFALHRWRSVRWFLEAENRPPAALFVSPMVVQYPDRCRIAVRIEGAPQRLLEGATPAWEYCM